MSWQIVPFQADHLNQLKLQPIQAFLQDVLGEKCGESIEQHSTAFTGLWYNEVVGCAGVTPLWPGVETAWALLGQKIPMTFVCIHKSVAMFLENRQVRRIETMVDCDHVAGHRWAHALGFICEAPCMSRRSADGRDMAMYARTKPWLG